MMAATFSMIGRTISHYCVLKKIGEGGMGVVYEAEDTRLNRTVALKFLSGHLLGDAEKRARFLREAQAAASLHHPNICTVHEIDEAAGEIFIAMACIDGEDLEERIAKGPLSLDQALLVAVQVADALQEAHSHGVVHRDIKPGNVLLSDHEQGLHVTITDFGLAQLANRSKLTRQNTVVGTVGYMSPEQTIGTDVDHRTDNWSLGVVLYEMVAGQHPFKGHYDEAVMYSITNDEPAPLTSLRSGVPLELEWIVEKALAKDPGERYQQAREFAVDLRSLRRKAESGKTRTLARRVAGPGALTAAAGVASRAHRPATPVSVDSSAFGPLPFERRLRLERGVMAVIAALLAAVVIWFAITPNETVIEAPLRKYTLRAQGRPAWPSISPDGQRVAYSEVGGSIWIHDLNRNERREVEGSQGGLAPFWSPDSRSVGFVQNLELRKASVEGAPVTSLCELPGREPFVPAAWSRDGASIVFPARPGGKPTMLEVSARGGDPQVLFAWEDEVEPEAALWTPAFLPFTDRPVLLFAVGTIFETQIYYRDLESGKQERIAAGFRPSYSPSGHIVYQESVLQQQIWALPFSLEDLAVTGKAFPIAQDALVPSLSRDATLVYEPTPPSLFRLVWKDRSGAVVSVMGEPQEGLGHLAVSPDGSLVAAGSRESQNEDLWVFDLKRGIRTRFTFDPGADVEPVWRPDGSEIVFSSTRNGDRNLFAKAIDGRGGVRQLDQSPMFDWPSSWSPDGRTILFTRIDPKTEHDIWALRLLGNRSWEARPVIQEPFRERNARFSPDGNYITYFSDESGRYEVYVQPFRGQGKWQVSQRGGIEPRWSPNGSELFYIEGLSLVAVKVNTNGGFSFGAAEPLFSDPNLFIPFQAAAYEISRDGQQILVREAVGEGKEPGIRVVQNWYAEFRDQR